MAVEAWKHIFWINRVVYLSQSQKFWITLIGRNPNFNIIIQATCGPSQSDLNAANANSVLNLGYDGWIVVEQDVLPGMETPKESTQSNQDYLKSIEL